MKGYYLSSNRMECLVIFSFYARKENNGLFRGITKSGVLQGSIHFLLVYINDLCFSRVDITCKLMSRKHRSRKVVLVWGPKWSINFHRS